MDRIKGNNFELGKTIERQQDTIAEMKSDAELLKDASWNDKVAVVAKTICQKRNNAADSQCEENARLALNNDGQVKLMRGGKSNGSLYEEWRECGKDNWLNADWQVETDADAMKDQPRPYVLTFKGTRDRWYVAFCSDDPALPEAAAMGGE